ncbi:MAG: hypothetical protein IV106_08260 [Pseudomonas umsongensis]|nr:hypothetical protein [Pseudomonas umsongensis]
MRITADRHPWNMFIELRAGIQNEQGAFVVVQPVVMEPIGEAEITEPFMRLKPADAQQLLDELWRCGIRPSQEQGSVGQAAAMQKHLDDMRTIAFHALKVKP